MRLTTLKVGFCRIYKGLQQLLLSLQVLPVLVRNSRIQDEVFPVYTHTPWSGGINHHRG